MKWLNTIFAGVFTLALGGAAHADDQANQQQGAQAKQEGKYCTAFAAVKQDLAKLDAIDKDSTVGELRNTVNKLGDDAREATNAAKQINTDTSKQLVQSAQKLKEQARSLPDDMSIADAKSKIGDDVMTVKRNAQKLAAESGCPEGTPAG